jgi:drug/metabolite transporter (DMT)-like permease
LIRIPKRYLLTCGGLFVLYELVYFGALGLSRTNEQAIAVSILNYLWPAMTLIFSIPLLGLSARPGVALGVVLALVGVALVEIDLRTFSGDQLISTMVGNPWPYVLGLAAGISWALYSALSRKWTRHLTVNPVPLYLLMCAVPFAAFGLRTAIHIHWTGRMLGELAYMTIVVAFLGYWLWNQAMQKGNVVLVISASYLTPLISVLVSWLYLGATLDPIVWMGCMLLVVGSVVCKLSASEPAPASE